MSNTKNFFSNLDDYAESLIKRGISTEKIFEQIKKLYEKKQNLELLIERENDAKKIKTLQGKKEKIEEEETTLFKELPNLVSSKTPTGKTKEDNFEIKKSGDPKVFDFKPLDYRCLLENLEKNNKISFFVHKFVQMQRALINFAIDSYSKIGGEEFFSPFFREGKNDSLETELKYFDPISYFFKYSFSENQFPYQLCGKALNLSTQEDSLFWSTLKNKKLSFPSYQIEFLGFCTELQSEELYHKIIGHLSFVLEELELPYRLTEVCSGQLDLSSMRTISFEAWLPSKNEYHDISSVSYHGSYLSRKYSIGYKSLEGEDEYPYLIKAIALEVNETLRSIVENYQNEDGSVTIPRVLRPYMGNKEFISND